MSLWGRFWRLYRRLTINLTYYFVNFHDENKKISFGMRLKISFDGLFSVASVSVAIIFIKFEIDVNSKDKTVFKHHRHLYEMLSTNTHTLTWCGVRAYGLDLSLRYCFCCLKHSRNYVLKIEHNFAYKCADFDTANTIISPR